MKYFGENQIIYIEKYYVHLDLKIVCAISQNYSSIDQRHWVELLFSKSGGDSGVISSHSL